MNRVILQLWEEAFKDGGYYPDGCSLHFNENHLDKYTKIFSKLNERSISYDRIVGKYTFVEICDDLFNKLVKNKNIRLTQIEMNNLISLQEIITIDD